MISENFVGCHNCSPDEHVIVYMFDNMRREVRIYPSPYLLDKFGKSVKLFKIKAERKLSRKESHSDFTISCPLCQKIAFTYCNVPEDWNVFIGEGLIRIPIEEIPDRLTFKNKKVEEVEDR